MKDIQLYNKFKNLDHDKLNDAFIDSCGNEQFITAKYLLTSTELKFKPDIHAKDDLGLKLACYYGCLDIVQFILIEPTLNEHGNIHAGNDTAFGYALEHNHLDIIQFFIYKMNIKKTSYIDDYLDLFPNEQVCNWFKLRELNETLEKELSQTKTNKTKIKV